MEGYNNPQKEYISLANLPPNEKGLISSIDCGRGLAGRLNSMGIRPEQKIRKICGLRGPVVFEINNTFSIAVGQGVAKKIIIEYNRKK